MVKLTSRMWPASAAALIVIALMLLERASPGARNWAKTPTDISGSRA
jgi:hypothetical protein